MHMADGLLSPEVGAAMWAVTAGATAYGIKKITGSDLSEKKLPVMAVSGAFVFAAQMINFTIPGTGSSGHFTGNVTWRISCFINYCISFSYTMPYFC